MTTLLFIILGFIPAFVISYIIIAFIFSRIPIQYKIQKTSAKIPVWVFSNGVHTDICLPLTSPQKDWTSIINTDDFDKTNWQYIAFGWGDKGFFMDTPTWAELKVSVAFKALFKLGETAMHVSLHEEVPIHNKWQKGVWISVEQYEKLIEYIEQSFQFDEKQNPIKIDFEGLPAYEYLNDNFYEAVGQYHFFKTCNCWVNEALKTAGVKTALWAPFSRNVFEHLEDSYCELPQANLLQTTAK